MIVTGACTVSPIPGGSGEIPIPGSSWNRHPAGTAILAEQQ